jgi:protein gp37
MLPINFELIEKYKHALWNIRLVESQKGSLHAIAYRYKFNSQYYLDLKDLKKARIIGALSGNTITEINWRIVNCETGCKSNDIARLTE